MSAALQDAVAKIRAIKYQARKRRFSIQLNRFRWKAHGAIVIARDLSDAVRVANVVASEHLELAGDDPAALLSEVRHAGVVFMGRHAPEALGDYVTGSNYVLPTSRAARFSSGLGLYDFMKRMSVQSMGADGFAAIAPAGLKLAEAEAFRHMRARFPFARMMAERDEQSPCLHRD